MNIYAGNRAALESPGGRRRRRQGATRGARSIELGRKTLGGEFAVFRIEQRAEDDDLAGELAMEEIGIVWLDAGTQIGKRKGLHIAGAALELQGHHPWHRAR